MKLIIQRVLSGSVTVDEGKESEYVSGKIGKGYVVLVGITRSDVIEDLEYLVGKLLSARLFPNEAGKEWSQNIVDIGGEILIVSQFTLYGVLNGNKPDFHEAMQSGNAKVLFDKFVLRVKEKYVQDRIQTGVFGGNMSVIIKNDGPVTLTLDSRVSTYTEGARGMAKIGGDKTWKKYCSDKPTSVQDRL